MLTENQFLKVRTGSPDPLDPLHQRMTFTLEEYITGSGVHIASVTMWANTFSDFQAGPAWLLYMVMLDLQNQMAWGIYKHFNLEGQSG